MKKISMLKIVHCACVLCCNFTPFAVPFSTIWNQVNNVIHNGMWIASLFSEFLTKPHLLCHCPQLPTLQLKASSARATLQSRFADNASRARVVSIILLGFSTTACIFCTTACISAACISSLHAFRHQASCSCMIAILHACFLASATRMLTCFFTEASHLWRFIQVGDRGMWQRRCGFVKNSENKEAIHMPLWITLLT